LNTAIPLGPLLLPATLLLVFACLVVTLFVGKRLAGSAEAQVQVSNVLWQTFLVGLVVARLAFVAQYQRTYLAAPLGILDIRDGGWNAAAGVVGAWLFVLYRQWRRPALRRALRASLATGTMLFAAGLVAMSLQAPARQSLPALSLRTLDGAAVQLDRHFVGRPTVVNLWATWCPPCVREMPVLQAAQTARPDVNFVFLNQGETAQQVGTWLASRGLALHNVLLDGQREVSVAFEQRGYPATLFFDARGQLAGLRIGELSHATLQEHLLRIAAPPTKTAPEGAASR